MDLGRVRCDKPCWIEGTQFEKDDYDLLIEAIMRVLVDKSMEDYDIDEIIDIINEEDKDFDLKLKEIINECVRKNFKGCDTKNLVNFINAWSFIVLKKCELKNLDFDHFIRVAERDGEWDGINELEKKLVSYLLNYFKNMFDINSNENSVCRLMSLEAREREKIIELYRKLKPKSEVPLSLRTSTDCAKQRDCVQVMRKAGILKKKQAPRLQTNRLLRHSLLKRITPPKGLPGWMPNSGNTCFISAVLWPLYLLLNEEISKSIVNWSGRLSPNSLNVARSAFNCLYMNMQVEEVVTTSRQVLAFRSAIQSHFPNVFEGTLQQMGQQDAADFLNVMVGSFLDLGINKKDAPKFFLRHEYETVEKSEEGHKIDDESQPVSFTIHISWEGSDMTSLQELVADPEPTHIFNKEILGRPSVRVKVTQRYVVETKERAPQIFICTLGRYSQNQIEKRKDPVFPSEVLEFRQLKGEKDERVAYDLVGVTVHQGERICVGHYYAYMRYLVDEKWKFSKYDDLTGIDKNIDEKIVISDVLKNGYIFYYKKREERALSVDHSSCSISDNRSFPMEIDSVATNDEARQWLIREDDKNSLRLGEVYSSIAEYLSNKFDELSWLESVPLEEEELFRLALETIRRPIYVITNHQQKSDLSFAAPHEPNKGVCYTEPGFTREPLYLFKQSNRSVVELCLQ